MSPVEVHPAAESSCVYVRAGVVCPLGCATPSTGEAGAHGEGRYELVDYMNAPSGLGPLASEWKDKPHRLVYDLVGRVRAMAPSADHEWNFTSPTCLRCGLHSSAVGERCPGPPKAGPSSGETDLDKLEGLYRQATDGPWSWEATGEKDNSWCLGTQFEGEVIDFVAQSGSCENLADPALIVAMHEALPKLIAELRRLRSSPALDENAVYATAVEEWRQRIARTYPERPVYERRITEDAFYVGYMAGKKAVHSSGAECCTPYSAGGWHSDDCLQNVARSSSSAAPSDEQRVRDIFITSDAILTQRMRMAALLADVRRESIEACAALVEKAAKAWDGVDRTKAETLRRFADVFLPKAAPFTRPEHK